MNINDMMNSAKGMMDDSQDVDGNKAEGNNGLAGMMDMAKDFNMEDLEKYKNMSKTELMQELKNSEHTETVINLIKGLIDKKS